MNDSLRKVSQKFNLRKSIQGWTLYDHIIQNFKTFFQHVDKSIWIDFSKFKIYYYQTLFKIMLEYKDVFDI